MGDADLMAGALAEYSGAGAREADGDGQLVADQIAEELRARGFVAVRNYGQSALKCHIAAKRAGHGAADDFQLAIQVDDNAHYGDADLSARYVVKPGVLRLRLGCDDSSRQGLARGPRQGDGAHRSPPQMTQAPSDFSVRNVRLFSENPGPVVKLLTGRGNGRPAHQKARASIYACKSFDVWGFLSGGQGSFHAFLSLAVMKTVNRLAPGDGFEQLPALFIGLTPCAGLDLDPVGTPA